MTRLSRLHPYPAMIADELATELGQQFVKPGDRVLDPFCGTGRTVLAAAERGAHCVGVDINPLATLITRAKSCSPRICVVEKFLESLPNHITDRHARPIRNIEFGRKVKWFPRKSMIELSALISWINHSGLENDELRLVAAILSATAREVSFCRQDGWKLHRISQKARKHFAVSAGDAFKRRLRMALKDLTNSNCLLGSLRILTGDARRLSHVLGQNESNKSFDVVITSPPYGDSRTTVQYGAMSALCLGVLRHLRGLNLDVIAGGEIDRRCLGGASEQHTNSKLDALISESWYWYGGVHNSARRLVHRFLWDVEICCREISKILRRGGRAVVIIGRRSVGGWRLNLDRFLIDAFLRRQMVLEGRCMRQIERKTIPPLINRHGHALGKAELGNRVSTMREEHILVFAKL